MSETPRSTVFRSDLLIDNACWGDVAWVAWRDSQSRERSATVEMLVADLDRHECDLRKAKQDLEHALNRIDDLCLQIHDLQADIRYLEEPA